MIALGTPYYKIKHDFSSDFTAVSEVKEEDSKFYSEEGWKIIARWREEAKAAAEKFSSQKKVTAVSEEEEKKE